MKFFDRLKYKVPDDGLSEAQKNSYIIWDNIDLPKFHSEKELRESVCFAMILRKLKWLDLCYQSNSWQFHRKKKKKKSAIFQVQRQSYTEY